MITQQRDSALTIAQFCQSVGVTPARYYYYKKKLQFETEQTPHGFLQASIIEERTTKMTLTQTCSDNKLDYHDATLTLNHVSTDYLTALLKGLAS